MGFDLDDFLQKRERIKAERAALLEAAYAVLHPALEAWATRWDRLDPITGAKVLTIEKTVVPAERDSSTSILEGFVVTCALNAKALTMSSPADKASFTLSMTESLDATGRRGKAVATIVIDDVERMTKGDRLAPVMKHSIKKNEHWTHIDLDDVLRMFESYALGDGKPKCLPRLPPSKMGRRPGKLHPRSALLTIVIPIIVAIVILIWFLGIRNVDGFTPMSQIGVFSPNPERIAFAQLNDIYFDRSRSIIVSSKPSITSSTPVQLFITGVTDCKLSGKTPEFATVIHMGPYNPDIATLAGMLPGRGGKLAFSCDRKESDALLGHPDASETVFFSLAYPKFAAHYVSSGYRPFSSLIVRAVQHDDSLVQPQGGVPGSLLLGLGIHDFDPAFLDNAVYLSYKPGMSPVTILKWHDPWYDAFAFPIVIVAVGTLLAIPAGAYLEWAKTTRKA